MSKERLLFVVTEDWYFYSHRKPMIRAAIEAGYDVGVITNVKEHKEKIESLGVDVIDFSFDRRSLNPFKALKQICQLSKIYKEQKPKILHHIAMKPILFGSIAALMSGVPNIVNAFAGLGYVYNVNSLKALLIRMILFMPFIFLLRRSNTHLLFQNPDDLARLKRSGFVVQERAHIIRGSGIDLEEYPKSEMEDPAPNLICVYAVRTLEMKGLPTLQQAFKILEEKGVNVELHLYGMPDFHNPGSWGEAQLKEWEANNNNVAYRGFASDMKQVWQSSHIALQVSYGGEGVPKSLLEAAAIGRPIIATNVPGCREMVVKGENGILVEPYDADQLASAIESLVLDFDLCREMGNNSRSIVESDLSSDKVTQSTKALYEVCLEGNAYYSLSDAQ